jgi:hypothetical protein
MAKNKSNTEKIIMQDDEIQTNEKTHDKKFDEELKKLSARRLSESQLSSISLLESRGSFESLSKYYDIQPDTQFFEEAVDALDILLLLNRIADLHLDTVLEETLERLYNPNIDSNNKKEPLQTLLDEMVEKIESFRIEHVDTEHLLLPLSQSQSIELIRSNKNNQDACCSIM